MRTYLAMLKRAAATALLALVLAGCAAATPAPTATLLPTPLPPTTTPLPPTPTAQPIAVQPTALSQSGTTPSALRQEELLAKGQLIFEKTAGGVGCQYCHGIDARGNIGPNIRGKSKEAILQALGTVAVMQQVIGDGLSDEDLEALAAYLKYLESQP